MTLTYPISGSYNSSESLGINKLEDFAPVKNAHYEVWYYTIVDKLLGFNNKDKNLDQFFKYIKKRITE